MRVKNSLLNFKDKVIYQDDDGFLFSLDTVLLANFVTINLKDKNIIDLCSGNAPIPMLLSFRTKARIFGVEIQKDIYELGFASVEENKMGDQIKLLNMDVKDLKNSFPAESFDVVTCNPPYFKYHEDSLINRGLKKSIARHEILIKLDEIIEISFYLLRNGGTFAMVHRPERLIEILELMKKNNIEPKKIRFVYPKADRDANMVLIEGIKNGKSGLKLLSPLITHDDLGNYCMEIKKMFGDDRDVAE